MTNLIKKNIVALALAAAFAVLFALDAFGLNMKSNLVAGGLMVVPAAILWTKAMNPKMKFDKEELFLSMFLAFFWISLLLNKTPYGYQEFITFTGGALVYLFASNLRTSKLPHKVIHWVTVLIVTAFSVFGIHELMTGPASRLDGLFHGAEIYSNYPNAMAQLLLFGIPVSWLLFRRFKFEKSKAQYILTGFLLVINIIALWLTFSRAGYVAFACMLGAGAAFYFIREKNPVELFKVIATVLTLVIVGWIGAVSINSVNEHPIDIEERVASEDVSSETSLTERYDFWSGSLKMASDSPLFGVGSGGFKYFYPTYQEGPLAISDHPHNLLLKVLTENGYLATIALVFFLILVGIKALWEYIWIKKTQSETFGVLMVVFLGLTLHNLVDYNLNFTLLWIIYFGVIGLLENAYTWHESRIADDHHRFIPNKKIYRAKLTIITAIVVGITAAQGYGYVELKAAEASFSEDSMVTNLHLMKAAKYMPFKQQYVELLGANMVRLDNVEFSFDKKFDEFYPTDFYKESINFREREYDIDTLRNLAQVYGKNDFSYHLIYLNAISELDLKDELAKASASYREFLNTYIELMQQNAHQTVATLNPYYADQLFNFFLLLDAPAEEVEEWKTMYAQYTEAWQLEIFKFNNRYNTKFNRITPDASINSNF